MPWVSSWESKASTSSILWISSDFPNCERYSFLMLVMLIFVKSFSVFSYIGLLAHSRWSPNTGFNQCLHGSQHVRGQHALSIVKKDAYDKLNMKFQNRNILLRYSRHSIRPPFRTRATCNNNMPMQNVKLEQEAERDERATTLLNRESIVDDPTGSFNNMITIESPFDWLLAPWQHCSGIFVCA